MIGTEAGTDIEREQELLGIGIGHELHFDLVGDVHIGLEGPSKSLDGRVSVANFISNV